MYGAGHKSPVQTIVVTHCYIESNSILRLPARFVREEDCFVGNVKREIPSGLPRSAYQTDRYIRHGLE